MDSFDGRRRREGRAPQPPAERRSLRETDPLEQRLDRWMSTGRQLVEGVAGGRPGARPAARGPEGRSGARGGFDGLGRWVEDRLDWLLDDGEDWREPWQESDDRRRADPSPLPARQQPHGREPLPAREQLSAREQPSAGEQPSAWEPLPQARRARPRRRPLEAISRRGTGAVAPVTPVMPATPLAPESSDPQEWPADDLFMVPRWQRPPAVPPGAEPPRGESAADPRRRPAAPENGEGGEPPLAARPLPRSTRRR